MNLVVYKYNIREFFLGPFNKVFKKIFEVLETNYGKNLNKNS